PHHPIQQDREVIPASIAAVVCVLGWRWLALVEQRRKFEREDEVLNIHVLQLMTRVLAIEDMTADIAEMQSTVSNLAISAGYE
ncbi:unnamed protein product, partial [marine sediment metagenome]